jgi:replication factor C subunit 2/4
MFRVTKTMPTLSEHSKLEFIRVSSRSCPRYPPPLLFAAFCCAVVFAKRDYFLSKEIGFTHMRILDGVQTFLQLSGCLARLCKINMKPGQFTLPKHDLI